MDREYDAAFNRFLKGIRGIDAPLDRYIDNLEHMLEMMKEELEVAKQDMESQ